MFSRNTSRAVRESFMAIVDISQEAMNFKYMGLPVYIEHSKGKTLDYKIGCGERS